MFAYCNNNPAIYSDETGHYTDGQIHDFVVEHIAEKSAKSGRILLYRRWDTLIIYDHAWRGKWFGFCDLYDPTTGEVWEVKKNSRSYTCSTAYATDQLNNYINNGYLVRYPSRSRSLPTTTIPSRTFSKYDAMNNKYTISYWYEGNGIIRYSYTIRLSKQAHVAIAVVVAGAACGMLSLACHDKGLNVLLQ
jgi:hypothetical protein